MMGVWLGSVYYIISFIYFSFQKPGCLPEHPEPEAILRGEPQDTTGEQEKHVGYYIFFKV